MPTGITMLTRIMLGIMLVFLAAAGVSAQDEEKSFTAMVDPDGVQRVEVLGGNYYFNPNVIVVKINKPVELKIRSDGGITPHNIVLKAPEAGIDFVENLDSEAKIIRFTPTRLGRYPFECDHRFLFFASHKEQGMHGVLDVVQ